MAIPATDARALFTKALVAVYKERAKPTSFLQSFFKSEEFGSKNLAISVQRGTEKIAVDVLRGAEGNRNSFSRSTEKMFEPPFYNEYFDATQLDVYDRLFTASGDVEENDYAEYINGIVDKIMVCEDKIKRAIELQCAQVLLTGIVTLNAGTNIDYKRKALSLADLSGSTWATDTNDPMAHLAAAAKWIRQNGRSQGDRFNVIMGESAKAAFNNNTFVENTANFRRIENMDLKEPQRNSVGGTTHGWFSSGDYAFNLWTYGEFYDNAAGESTPYIDPKKIIVIPESTNFNLSFAAVPQLIDGQVKRTKGAFHIYDFVDQRATAHIYGVKSAPLAIPTAVDQIYTAQVLV